MVKGGFSTTAIATVIETLSLLFLNDESGFKSWLRCLPPSSLLGVLPKCYDTTAATPWLCSAVICPLTGELECSFRACSLERYYNYLVDWAELPNVLVMPPERPTDLFGVSDGVKLA